MLQTPQSYCYTHLLMIQELDQIWNQCCIAAETIQIMPALQRLMIANISGAIGCRLLLREDFDRLEDADSELCEQVSKTFDAVLQRSDDNLLIISCLNQLGTACNIFHERVFTANSVFSRLLTLIAARSDEDRQVRFQQIITNALPSSAVVIDMINYRDLHQAIATQRRSPSEDQLLYHVLNVRLSKFLPNSLVRVSSIVWLMTKHPFALDISVEDLSAILHSFVEQLSSTYGANDWINKVFGHKQLDIGELAAYAMAIDGVWPDCQTDKIWFDERVAWLHSVMGLILDNSNAQLILILAGLQQLNANLCHAFDLFIPPELTVKSVADLISDFEAKLLKLHLLTVQWPSFSMVWKHKIGNAKTTRVLAIALLELESHIRTQAVIMAWLHRFGFWSFPLFAIARDESTSEDFVTIRNSVIELAKSLPKEFVIPHFHDRRIHNWLRQVSESKYSYALAELLVDLETVMEHQATSSAWLDFRLQWGVLVHSSFTPSTLALCLLDLEKHLSEDIVFDRPRWRSALTSIATSDEPGRIAIIKRHVGHLFAAIRRIHWAPEFRERVQLDNTGHSSFFTSLSASRTSLHVVFLVYQAASMIMSPSESHLTEGWVAALNAAFNSFLLSACLISFDMDLPDGIFGAEIQERLKWRSGFRNVRLWHASNHVRCLREIMMSLEDHIECSAMFDSWDIDRENWKRLVSYQTNNHDLVPCLDILKANLKQDIRVEVENSRFEDYLLAFDRCLPDIALNPEWNRIRDICRIYLKKDASPFSPLIAVSSCIASLLQNTVCDGKYSTETRIVMSLDIESLKKMMEDFGAFSSMRDWNVLWGAHYPIWQRAIRDAELPSDLAFPVLTVLQFLNAAKSASPCHLSHFFRRILEVWELVLFTVIPIRSLGCEVARSANTSLSKMDMEFSRRRRIDMSLDELLPVGILRAIDFEHAHVKSATTFADLGMGFGQAILQVFSCSTSLKKCIGVEAAESRFAKATLSASTLPSCEVLLNDKKEFVLSSAQQSILDLRCGDLFDCEDGIKSDIVLLYINLNPSMHRRLCNFILRMQSGARLITNFDVPTLFSSLSLDPAPFAQLAINQCNHDRFLASSSPVVGLRLFIFVKH
uniref:DOT1 domain-containing protein n=1 Tax=Spongospora subterranea TaxID=70186 RepID=A0A0H5QRK7_9EUKA|eukprot:CRZ04675.1 hypothetical protein [Spongospora subterranea]